MKPKEKQLRISSSELFHEPHPSNIVDTKNGGSKRAREVSNERGDFKKSRKQKSKSKMKEVIRNLESRVTIIENEPKIIYRRIEGQYIHHFQTH